MCQVGQNPAAIKNVGFSTVHLRPGQSALLRDGAKLEFLPGRLRFRLDIPGAARSCTAEIPARLVNSLSEGPGGGVSGCEDGGVQEGAGAQLSDAVASLTNRGTPPLIGADSMQAMQPDCGPPGSEVRDSHMGGFATGPAEPHQPAPAGRARPSTQGQHWPPTEPLASPQDQLAQDEELARRLQEEEGGTGGARSHLSKEQLASDEALARALQKQWAGGANEGDGRETRAGGPERKRPRISEGADAGEPSTSGQLPEEGGTQGTGGPGSFQLLQARYSPQT